MKRDLSYYLALPYSINIKPIPEEHGGGFEASIPRLGTDAFIAHGDTIEEALARLERVKAELLEELIQQKAMIPEPEEDLEYSGKFVLRIPRHLHKRYAEYAKEQDISLNQAVLLALTTYMSNVDLLQMLEKKLDKYFAPARTEQEYSMTMKHRIGAGKAEIVSLHEHLAETG